MSVARLGGGAERDRLVGACLDGRYTIRSVHSRGGMGVVYAAVHDDLQREVAIKVLDESWASNADAIRRFLDEARTASSLTHSNIVDVQDLGHLPDGRPYLVMPMIKGTDLATLLAEEGPQSPERVASLLTGVAAALDLIHARGLVHHDIKPENLMLVRREDGSEAVLVLDFGIAGARFPHDRRGIELFDRGTPEFMPPEAATGVVPDRRGDVYALATVAFELMTGWLPFDSDDVDKLARLKATSTPSSMTQVSGHAFPLALEAVIARGLATRPADRFASAGEFVRRLSQVAHSTGATGLGSAPGASDTTGEGRARPSRSAVAPVLRPSTQRPRRPPRMGKRLPTLVAAGGIPRGLAAPAPASSEPEPLPSGPPPDVSPKEAPPPSAPAAGPAAATPASREADAAPERSNRPVPVPPPPAGAGAGHRLRGLRSSTRPGFAGRKRGRPADSEAPEGPAAPDAPETTQTASLEPQAPSEDRTTESSGTFLRAGAEPAATAAAQHAQPPDPPAAATGVRRGWPFGAAGEMAPTTQQAPPTLDASTAPAPDPAAELDAELTFDPRPAWLRPRMRSRLAAAAVLALVLLGAAWAFGVGQPESAVAPAPAVTPTPPPPAPEAAAPSPASTPKADSEANTEAEAPAEAQAADAPPQPEPARASASPPTDNSRTTRDRADREPRRREPRARATDSRSERRTSRSARPAPPPPDEPAPRPAAGGDAADLSRQATDAMLQGDLRAALQLYERALGADRRHAPAWRGKGLVLERMGNKRPAAAAYRTYLQLAPQSRSANGIRKRLKELE